MTRLLTCFILLVSMGLTANEATRTANLYPNELAHFKFYAKYLAPLQPYISEHALVVSVLGSDREIELPDWRIQPYWVGEGNTVNGRPWIKNLEGRLASVDVRPKRPFSMLKEKFPAKFTHSSGSVSEINVACDVYGDSFGLQYWVYSEDSAVGKKGDLMQIVYGPSKLLENEAAGSSQ
jgi:hypothetical protein